MSLTRNELPKNLSFFENFLNNISLNSLEFNYSTQKLNTILLFFIKEFKFVQHSQSSSPLSLTEWFVQGKVLFIEIDAVVHGARTKLLLLLWIERVMFWRNHSASSLMRISTEASIIVPLRIALVNIVPYLATTHSTFIIHLLVIDKHHIFLRVLRYVWVIPNILIFK